LSISVLKSANGRAPRTAAAIVSFEIFGSVRPIRKAGVAVIPIFCTSAMSRRIAASCLSPATHASKAATSRPIASACGVQGSSAFWLANSRSCISQYFP